MPPRWCLGLAALQFPQVDVGGRFEEYQARETSVLKKLRGLNMTGTVARMYFLEHPFLLYYIRRD